MRFEIKTDIAKVFDRKYEITSAAVGAAIAEVGEAAKLLGRANIAGQGFSENWQNALRLEIYQPGTIHAAAYVFHKIPYSGVFEKPRIVSGVPLLWLPTKEALKNFKGYKGGRITPKEFIRQGRKLKSVNVPGKPPMLFGTVVDSGTPGALFGRRRGVKTKSIPLFYGVPLADMKTRFDIAGAVARAARDLPNAFLRNLKDD